MAPSEKPVDQDAWRTRIKADLAAQVVNDLPGDEAPRAAGTAALLFLMPAPIRPLHPVLKLLFPDHCEAVRYDTWDFYRKSFQSIVSGTKAVDILCIAQDASWLIEVKDYRQHPRTKPIDLGDEVARKVRDTLSGLAAASANAQDSGERGLAIRALAKQRWRVALHLEQQTGSALRPQAINSADVLQKLRRQLKAIDAKPLVLNRQTSNLAEPWTVQ